MGTHRVGLMLLALAAPTAAISISQSNPHYLEFRGRTTVLSTSAEHYGGLINTDFDYAEYFETLGAHGLSLTQAFVGSYVEPDDDCDPTGLNPTSNPLSPANGSYIAPWARAQGHPGGPKAGNKFDLTTFDTAYFERLEKYVSSAAKHGVVVQLVLFCGYDAKHQFIFDVSPLNPANNVNAGMAGVNRSTVYTRDAGPAMLEVQLAMARKLATAVQHHDNVMFELIFTSIGTEAKWAAQVAAAVRAADPDSLIIVPREWVQAMPFTAGILANCGAGSNCTDAAGAVRPPADPGRPVLLDSASAAAAGKTPFEVAQLYRAMYWRWMLDGGAVAYNLDWSYTVDNEDGTKQDAQTKATPSGPVYRQIMSVLGRFMGGLELDGLAPRAGWITFEGAGIGASTARGGWPRAASVDRVSALAPTRAVGSGRGGRRAARTYVAYVPAGVNAIKVSLRANTPVADFCECEWLDTVSGKVTHGQSIRIGNWTLVAVPKAAGAAGVVLTAACH